MQTAILAGLTLGALGSLHCAGMCGPLVAACMGAGRGDVSVNKASLLYQFGRISTYVTLGLLFGYFGSSLELLAGQSYASIFAGVLLVFVGLFGRKLEAKIGATTVLAKAFGYTSARFGSAAPLGFGLLNGLLPCGLVYTALAASLAFGDPLSGAVFMLSFGIATSPLLMAVSYVSLRWRGLSSKLFPIFSLIAGAVLLFRGLQVELPADWMNYLVMHPELECH
ncbi:MAG: sulfite exporter TauE/SafE family protein [Saprospiraceae bacterium]